MRQLSKSWNSAIRWLMALIWSILIIFLLLKPGSDVPNQEWLFSSFITSFFSLSLNRKELSEAIGHVFLFGVLTILWQRVLIRYFYLSRALLSTIGIVVMLAIGTEIGQYFVNRSSLLLDLLANFLGIVLSLLWIKCQINHQ